MCEGVVEFTELMLPRLKEGFPQRGYSVNESRGVKLIGPKVSFVISRMNDVFGMAGLGWRFSLSPPQQNQYNTRGGDPRVEIVTAVCIQYRVGEKLGTWPMDWSQEKAKWAPSTDREKVWSEPIYGYGGSTVRGGGSPWTDAMKGASSDALSKAASKLGVGDEAYKGLLYQDGQEIKVVGEDGEESLAEITSLITESLNDVLVAAINHAPDLIDILRENNDYVQAFYVARVLKPTKAYIDQQELSQFVSDNLPTLAGDDSVEELNHLSVSALKFIANAVKAISSSEITWKQAKAVAEIGVQRDSWDFAFAEWKRLQEESDG